MQRVSRPRVSLVSSAVAVAGVTLAGLLALSMAVQPPREAGADTLEQLLGWLRAGMLTLGAIAFLAAIGVSFCSPPTAEPADVIATPRTRRQSPAAFTLVALDGTPDDTRAITDASTAEEAVDLLWQWADEHPTEHVVVYDLKGEPIAFKRPALTQHRRT